MAAKRRNPGDHESRTPLRVKADALAQQEAKVIERMERCQRLIDDAPKIAKERERDRREELVARASRTEGRGVSRAALPDRRFGYEANVAAPAQRRRLRAERQQGRLTFFVLLIVFSAVACWLYYTVTHP